MTEEEIQAARFQAIESLGRLTELMDRRRQQLSRRVGLTPQQWQALEGISRAGFLPSLFARSSQSSRAGVSRTLRQLLERKLVEVSASADDARKREYLLTAAGRRVLEALLDAREHALGEVWTDLPPDQLAQFAEFGALLADRLAAYAERSEPDGG
jgi:DNA-binding MarR family transcriptional regulator